MRYSGSSPEYRIFDFVSTLYAGFFARYYHKRLCLRGMHATVKKITRRIEWRRDSPQVGEVVAKDKSIIPQKSGIMSFNILPHLHSTKPPMTCQTHKYSSPAPVLAQRGSQGETTQVSPKKQTPVVCQFEWMDSMSACADGGGRETLFRFRELPPLFFEAYAASNSAQGTSSLT